jgi:DNA-directed RNA polymerase II subunit RPB1
MSIYKELSYNQEIDPVKGIQFSVLSPDEIIRGSVLEVTKTDTYAGNEPVPNGLFDPRMGVLEHNAYCRTCEQKNIFCPGHFGHIKLARPVFHPLFFENTRKLLKCICHRCSRLLISSTESSDEYKEQVQKILQTKNLQKRWELMFKLCNNANRIRRCGDDGAPGCGAKQPSRYTKEGTLRIFAEWREPNVETVKREFTAEEVLTIFQRISEADMEVLGFNSKFNRPEWLISTVIPVPPPPVRPSIIEENGQRREDDLTHKLCDIIKTNNQLKIRLEKPNANEEHLSVITGALQYHYATFLDNQIPGLPPAQQRNGRKLKSVSDRLKKKEGRIRGNLNGKRVDQSARSVITPDPYISLDELGVPVKIAMNLTFPEMVNSYNIEEMRRLVRNGPNEWPGSKDVRKKEDGKTYTLKYGDRNKIAEDLVEGDIVDRHLRDGDYVLFNRQPSLHKMSMMCHRVKVMPYQTFRLNVLVTSPYNADFDGDEMNLHAPQSIQTMSELKDFANVPYHIIGPKDGKPIIEVVQDTMVGSFRLTKDHVRITDKTFANLQMVNSYFSGVLPDPEYKETREYTGRQASSQIMPPGMHLTLKNKLKEVVSIQNRKHISGTLDKNIFHTMSQGIVPVIYHDYNPFEVRRFLDNLQRLVCRWLLTSGFSVGISDLVVEDTTKDKLKEIIVQMKSKAYEELEKVRNEKMENNSIMNNQDYFEQSMISILNGATNNIEKNGLEGVHHLVNRMINMVQSGSKGKPTNVAQMIACVGQQNVDGKRVAYGFTDRTLPHYNKYDDGPSARGFVENSFIGGLTPQEMFFHAMGGREGLID